MQSKAGGFYMYLYGNTKYMSIHLQRGHKGSCRSLKVRLDSFSRLLIKTINWWMKKKSYEPFVARINVKENINYKRNNNKKQTNCQQIVMGDPNPPVFQLRSLVFVALSSMCRPQDHSWRNQADSEWKVFVPFRCCSHEQEHHLRCNLCSCPFHPPPLAAHYLRGLQSRLQSHCSRCRVQVCPRLKE